MTNDVASVILWLLVAVFILHLIEGNARDWVASKFRVAVKEATSPGATTPSQLPNGTYPAITQPKPSGGGILGG